MGPVAAKSYPGQQAIAVDVRPAHRATQEIDYGRRAKGYVFGALWETTGACWTQCHPRRTKAAFLDFLSWVDEQIPAETQRLSAILDHLSMHHCADLLLFQIHHPRWELVYQPKYAAYLNLIEPWWKILRSLALAGRRFETWQQIVEAVEVTPGFGNIHRHPFRWGRRPRHQPPRRAPRCTFAVKVLRI